MGNSLWIGSSAQVHKGKIRQLDTVRIVEEFNEHPQRDSGLFLSLCRSALVPRPATAGKREMISKARRNPRGSTSSLPDKASGKRERETKKKKRKKDVCKHACRHCLWERERVCACPEKRLLTQHRKERKQNILDEYTSFKTHTSGPFPSPSRCQMFL